LSVSWAEWPTGDCIAIAESGRVHVLLQREGWGTNIKRTYRIYRGLGLQLRNKTPKRRVKAKLREDRQKAVGPNDVWEMDFVHDQFAIGKNCVF
jgi:putative transposase